eukprot:Em0073g6a
MCLLIIICHFVSQEGHAYSLTCDASLSQPICPGAMVSCTCTVAGTTSNTRWVFTSIKPCPSTSNTRWVFTSIKPCPSTSNTRWVFTSIKPCPSTSNTRWVFTSGV